MAPQPTYAFTCGNDRVEQRRGEDNQEHHDGREAGPQDFHDGSLNFLGSESAFVGGEPIDGGPRPAPSLNDQFAAELCLQDTVGVGAEAASPPSKSKLTRVKFGRMDNIRGKTIAITGAARGIGYATAKALLARGARVVIGDRDVAVLESAVTGLSSSGQVSGYPLDVTDKESFATFLDKARTDGSGHLDVLINNAGVMPVGAFLEQSEQAIRSAIEVNFYGVLTGCRLVLPDMVKRRSGHIVNVASMAGMVAVPGQLVYAGTKFAVVGLSTAMADEFAPRGVEVTVIMPTFTNTELIAGTNATGASKPVQPEDIAAAIVKALDKPKTHVSVPAPLRFVGAVTSMLGPRGRRWLAKQMGTDRVFLDFDTQARKSYEDRAQNATGVVDQ
jgi:short-subunit dehydrogenase